MTNKRSFKHLLIVMTDHHIGNLLVSLYAIQSVQQQLKPEQSLTCVMASNLLPLVHYLLPDTHCIPYSLRDSKTSPIKKLPLFAKMFFTLRSRNIDTAVDLYGHGESYYIARLSGATFISSYYSTAKLKPKYHWSDLSTEETPQHQIDYYRYPFIPLMGIIVAATIKAPEHPKTFSLVKDKLSKLNISMEKPLVIIHPGAGKEYKLWPTKHWQKLINKLEECGHQVLLIGAGIDQQQVDAIMDSHDISPINGFQCFNLIETIHLGFIAKLMVGNDSGPTHLMATTPTTVFSLFGPTDHQLWSPLSPHSHILRAEVDCLNSCSKQTCQKDISCLEALSPDYVFDHITSARP
ncbi:MAG: glycosyltransferase family 9 protein [Pseudomonadales bacterium]